jgi:hypothetical protein
MATRPPPPPETAQEALRIAEEAIEKGSYARPLAGYLEASLGPDHSQVFLTACYEREVGLLSKLDELAWHSLWDIKARAVTPHDALWVAYVGEKHTPNQTKVFQTWCQVGNVAPEVVVAGAEALSRLLGEYADAITAYGQKVRDPAVVARTGELTALLKS